MSCRKAQEFLESAKVAVADRADARKQPHGPEEALALARTATQVVVGKGKKVITFDMTSRPPDDATLLAHLLGPTGNLRAPSLRVGKTLLVGFSPEAYREVLGR